MSQIPFQTIDWSAIEKTEYKGETGTSYWQTTSYVVDTRKFKFSSICLKLKIKLPTHKVLV